MLGALAQADGLAWASILVKAAAYAAALIAAGSALANACLGALDAAGRRRLGRIGAASAIAAAALGALGLPVQAAFLAGAPEGTVDPTILGLVADGPLGAAMAWRALGLALILALPRRGGAAAGLAAAGAAVVCASFALRGHSVGEPRLLLGALITAHMLALAFWLGALAPLADAARRGPPALAAALAREFGAKALWAVGALVLAGAGLFVRLAGASAAVLGSDYGAFFAIKLAVFAGVLGLAALNRLRLTPALAAEAPGATARLRRSIGVEAALIGVVLLITAAATTLTAPAPP